MMDFSNLQIDGSKKYVGLFCIRYSYYRYQNNVFLFRYREDIIQKGQVKGSRCSLNGKFLENNADQRGFLQSW